MKGVGDFYSGMLHPLTALEFLLSWVALAMFAGQQGRKTALLTLAIFPIRACIRRKLRHSRAIARLAARDESGSHPNPGSRGSARDFLSKFGNCDLGSPRRTPAWVLAYGIGLVRSVKKPWTRIAVRVAGSWITAAGIMVCAVKL
jgi:hydrogenase/urease accessory protein HupE